MTIIEPVRRRGSRGASNLPAVSTVPKFGDPRCRPRLRLRAESWFLPQPGSPFGQWSAVYGRLVEESSRFAQIEVVRGSRTENGIPASKPKEHEAHRIRKDPAGKGRRGTLFTPSDGEQDVHAALENSRSGHPSQRFG